jgi:hypothetical protein
MTPPAATAPPPDAAKHAPAPAAAATPRARAPFSRPRAERPPLVTPRTLAVSLGLHILLLLAVLVVPPPPERLVVAPEIDDSMLGREVVDYMEVGEWGGMATDPSASLPEPAAAPATGFSAASADSALRALPNAAGPFPSRVPTSLPSAAAGQAGQPGAAVPGAPGGVPGGQPGTAGARRSGPGGLGPELGDPRLVVRPTAVPEGPVEDVDRYRRHFEGRIQALNDSLAGEAERRRRATDWTITDRSGRKWGINERGPVVGGRNVPIPVPSPPRRSRELEEADRRERAQRGEIDRQAETIERDRYLRERGKAIREREDREREQEKQGSTPP